MTGLVLEDVWKDHGPQIVLERVNLTIAPRAFVALVGASGCGKSTLRKLLPGQEAPSRGRITLDGAPPGAEPGPDRGVVFQRYSVFAHLPVLGNVMLGNVMLGRDLAGARRCRGGCLARRAGPRATRRRPWSPPSGWRGPRANTPPSCRGGCSSASRSRKR
jgi:ABC-type nitrate/sulfonate/bicarbonate transport system ATPase subunit